MAVPIDGAGNVDTRRLQRELGAALAEDRQHRATDAMKKRAIHAAQSYDEFRGMVACASLKPVTSAEIDELRRGKQGWAKKSSAAKGAQTSRLASGGSADAGHIVVAAKPATKSQKPKTTMEFEREWRRLSNEESARISYLLGVGLKRCQRLFKMELDAGLLEELLQTLLESFDANAVEASSATACTINAETLLAWLEMLTKSQGFSSLSLAMIATDLRQRVLDTVARLEGSETIDKEAVIASFTLA